MKRILGTVLALVLLIGKVDESADATSGATTREAFETKTSIIE